MTLEEGDVAYQGDFTVAFEIFRILILQLEIFMDIDGFYGGVWKTRSWVMDMVVLVCV